MLLTILKLLLILSTTLYVVNPPYTVYADPCEKNVLAIDSREKLKESIEQIRFSERISMVFRLSWHAGQRIDLRTTLMLFEMIFRHNKNHEKARSVIDQIKLLQGYVKKVRDKVNSGAVDEELLGIPEEIEKIRRRMAKLFSSIDENSLEYEDDDEEELYREWRYLCDVLYVIENFCTRSYQKQEIGLRDLMQRSIETVDKGKRDWANNNGVVQLGESTNICRINCDPVIMSFALGQIFNNAYHFSADNLRGKSGGREITQIKIEIEDGKIIIEDNGPGFAEDLLEYVPGSNRQRAFVFGESRRERGTGLGLALLWEVLNDHNMSITVKNMAKGGTRFEIIVPEMNQNLSVELAESV